MQDVHNAHLSFFSPRLAGFFFSQQIAQVAWLYRLWKVDEKDPKERRELEVIADYAPWYTLGNICIASGLFPLGLVDKQGLLTTLQRWMFFWNASNLKTAHLFVTINSTAQLLLHPRAPARARHLVMVFDSYAHRLKDLRQHWRA